MATYKLIPSSLTADDFVENASNAYTDTDSSTYAEANFTNGEAWLSGFDFSVIPNGETVSSIVVKCKVGSSEDQMCLYGTSSGTALSQTISLSDSVTVYTFTLTESASTILQYSSTLGIHFELSVLGGYAEIYGAEIIITTSTPMPNKIIYGGNTLIDLTGDTVTASDVVSGKTFHLASGIQATGALVASLSKATAISSSSTATSLEFTGLSKEPSFFVALPNDGINTSFSGTRAICFLYDGETTYKIRGWYASSKVQIMGNSASFTYSSGTLTVMSSSTSYILTGKWYLFYI